MVVPVYDKFLNASGLAVPLTPRESQLVVLVAEGLKNKEIAWRLHISEGTIKVYLSRLFQKLGKGRSQICREIVTASVQASIDFEYIKQQVLLLPSDQKDELMSLLLSCA